MPTSSGAAPRRSACAIFEPFNLVWIEEPLDAYDHEGHAALAAQFDTPIATGEMLTSAMEHGDLIRHRAADYLMPDAPRVGGSIAVRWSTFRQRGAAFVGIQRLLDPRGGLARRTAHALRRGRLHCWLASTHQRHAVAAHLHANVSLPSGWPTLGLMPPVPRHTRRSQQLSGVVDV